MNKQPDTLNLDNQTPIKAIIPFQPIGSTAPLGEAARAAISKTVLQFYVQSQPQEETAQGITALYERLSQEDGQGGRK